MAAAGHDHLAGDRGIDPSRQQRQNRTVAADGKSAGSFVGGVVEQRIDVADFDSQSDFGMFQIHMQMFLAEEFFDPRGNGDFNVLGAEGECLVAPPCADPERHTIPLRQNRIEKFMNALRNKVQNRLHVRCAFQCRREGFQSGTPLQSFPDDLQFLVRKRGVVFPADVDPAAHAGKPERVERRTLVFQIVDEFVFKHGPVVAFRGDLVIPADDAVVHGAPLGLIPNLRSRPGNGRKKRELRFPEFPFGMSIRGVISRFRRARPSGSDGSCRSGRCRSL